MDAFNLRAYRVEYRARQRVIEEFKDEMELMRVRHKAEIDALFARREEKLKSLKPETIEPSAAAGGRN